MDLRAWRGSFPLLPWLALVATSAAGIGLKLRCLGADGLTRDEAFVIGCYSDVLTIHTSRGLGRGVWPYLDVVTEYPPLTGVQWWSASWATGSAAAFFLLTSVVAVAALAAVQWLLQHEGVAGRRLLLLAASPVVLLTALVNWDAVPTLLLVAAIVAHRRDRHVLSGLLAGAGAAAKLFPGLLVPLVAWGLLDQGRRRTAIAHVGAAVGVFAGSLAVIAAVAPDGWDAFISGNASRPADWDTLWYAAQALTRAAPTVDALNAAVAVTVLSGWGVVATRGRSWPPEERWRLVLPLLLWLLVAGKVYSPQFTLWVLPLLAWLAPIRLTVLVLLADLAVVATRFPFLATQAGVEGGGGYGPFVTAIVLRAALLLLVMWAMLRDPPAPAGQRSEPGASPLVGRGGDGVSAAGRSEEPPPVS